ncbi:AraC family transcriptional regulator [Niveibacterium sp. COAC-50]|uniref:helix-turn-helix transcriptional regulator n=1 Tax=Niveibacterium sp. COAC-50 TaxID=2729384 RepID=UPI0015578357|nr:AraC family transcriptional regulator [Niveibacterium sp. COAC-50]
MTQQQFWRDPSLPFVESRRAWQSRACYRPHTHPTLSIGAVDAGCSLLQVEGQADQALQAGDVVVIPANRVHACNPVPEAAWSYQMLYLDVGWVGALHDEIAQHANAMRPARPKHFRNPDAHRRFCQLNDVLFSPQQAAAKEEALIGFVGGLAFDAAAPEDSPPRWVADLTTYLDRHCDQNLSILELAKLFGVSRYHLIRVFKLNTGLAPHAFQIDCRVNKARELLRDGEAIADVASQLGFSDQSHFQRAFRQRVSVTPGDYQRRIGR